MQFRSQSLYGNEWIEPGKKYFRIPVAQDGMYQISYLQLQQAGIPVSQIPADSFHLFHFGIEVEMIRSNPGIMNSQDYLWFYGTRNRAELDVPLFENQSEGINREYSMFNDTSSYYLSWNNHTSINSVLNVANDLSVSLPREDYFIYTAQLVFSDGHFKRANGSDHEFKFPLFDACQGYATEIFQSRQFSLNFENAFISTNPIQINVTYTGFGDDAGLHQSEFEIAGNTSTDQFNGYQLRRKDVELPSAAIKNQLNLKMNATGGPEDFLAVSVIEYAYEHQFNFNQASYQKILLKDKPGKRYLELSGFNGGNELVVYDLSNHYYLLSNKESNNTYRIMLPESTGDREIILFNKSAIINVTALKEINFINYSSADYNYVVLYNPRLTDDGNGNNYVQEYMNYRASPEGGAYRVASVNVENLYDQFAYGIHTHPLAVKNFAQYLRTIWPNVGYFLVIGKGLDYYSYRQTGLDTQYFFVPTYSYPASDIMLVTDNNKQPMYAFGRLPVINGTELKNYLDKVKSHESFLKNSIHDLDTKEWPKRIVHLSGGDPGIYAWISHELDIMKDSIESGKVGAHVETFYKQSSNTIEVSNSEKLKNAINSGSSIIAFMGHSASVRLDFNLENVDSYKNKDRYHLFMAMGCYAGAMFSTNRSISEDHNLAAEKGSIIYLANTTAGLPNILGVYGQEFYHQMGSAFYAKPVGDAINATFKTLLKIGGETLLTQAYSTSFNGDPAIRLNVNKDQDYTVDPKSVSTNPSLLFTSQKEFELKFDVVNLGAYIKDSISVKIDKKLPNGKTSTVYNKKILTPAFRTTLTVTIPIDGDEGIGYNTIYISLDALDAIAEGPLPYAENNNDLELNGQKGYVFYLFGNEARPVYPTEFAIIHDNTPVLIASNGNTLATKSNYYVQLDTSENFNSPLLIQNKIAQTGGIIHWTPSLNLIPNTVYYWRTAPDSSGSGVFAWRSSSFIYIPNSKDGWNQSHYFQYKKNDFYAMQINEPQRSFRYADAVVEFRVNNGYIELPTYIRPRTYVGSDVASDYQYWLHNSDFSGVVVNVFDPLTGALWINKSGGDYNSLFENGYINQPFFIFKTSNAQERAALISFLESTVPADHVVVFSTLSQFSHSYYPEQWESDGVKNIYATMEAFGAKNIRALKSLNSVPYVFIFRKGRVEFETKESIGNFMDEIDISHSFTILQTAGSVQSRIIGPAISWSSFQWDYHDLNVNTDQQELNIYGIDANNLEDKLYTTSIDKLYDLSSVDANHYPKIKLEWKTSDTSSRSSSQMDYWRVLYKGLPDAAFNPALLYEKNKDSLNQGDILQIKIAAQNIGVSDLDSLLVKFTIVNQLNQQTISYKRFIPLSPLATLEIPFSFNTSKIYGPQKLFIELNPDQDQKELYTFNNTVIIPFHVRRDRRKPFMEVTFDRIPILNEEIVSSKAEIEISLQDENKDLLLNDTSIFTLRVKEPGGSLQRIYFAQNNVQFIPATGTSNKVKVIIHGNFQKDGIYTLYVNATDGSGNTVSDQDYKIDFSIITKSMVGNLFNYPNPFTSKTRFVYTLTGDRIPDNYMIQILTISGKVVREITKDELGPLYIGTHMTDFEYKGTDEFGEKLANGVYLYRFVVRDNYHQALEHYDNHTDQYFKNDFGKMVIVR
jgi:hypothetical protein